MITINFLQKWRKPLVIRGSVSEEPSMTIPDDSYTIRDILNQFTSGIQPPMASYDQYDGDNPDFDDIDITTTFGDLADYDAARLEQMERVINAKRKQVELEEFERLAKLQGQKPKKGDASGRGAAAPSEREVSKQRSDEGAE